eukprot:413030_1
MVNEETNSFKSVNGFEYGCAYCEDGNGHNDDDAARIWSKCTSLRFDADTIPDIDHYGCVTHNLLYRPSAVTNRDACTCYKAENKKSATTYIVPKSELPAVTLPPDGIDDDIIIDPMIIFVVDEDTDDLIELDFPNDLEQIYLSQQDIMDGTYRITKSGYYILTEDIIFNFNPPPSSTMSNHDDWSPNSYDNYDPYWYTRHDQQDIYPG